MKRKTFQNHVNLRKREFEINKIRAQKGEVEISKEIVEERKITDDDIKLNYRKKNLDIDKIKAQKGDTEISKEIVEERRTVYVPHLGLLSWIGGTVLLFWALGLIFSIGGFMIHWLLLIAAIVFIVDMMSGKNREEI